jgi:hypothetical protein
VIVRGGEAPFDKERFVNAQSEDYWNLGELFENAEVDIDPLDDKLAAQLGSIKWTWGHEGGPRSSRRTTCGSGECHRLIEPTTLPKRSLVVVLAAPIVRRWFVSIIRSSTRPRSNFFVPSGLPMRIGLDTLPPVCRSSTRRLVTRLIFSSGS